MSEAGPSHRRNHRNYLQEFHLLSSILLTRSERQTLYKILKDYQRRHSIQRLVQGLRLVLRSNQKLELLKYIRLFLAKDQVTEFDHLTNYQSLFRVRKYRRKKRNQQDNADPAPSVASTSGSGHMSRAVHVITINRDPRETSLGFSVRGGSEHGLGIYVSEIDTGSVAEQSGLQLGDKMLEVNNISLKGVASSSAVKVLTGSNRLKLVLQRTHKVPEWRLSREKTAWYDVHDKKLIRGEFEECGIAHYIRGLDVDVPERRVNLKFHKSDKTLGFNVRGGTEYGLGVYVSSVDIGGLAEENGVRIGDQIIDVNGIPFDNITHSHAVEVLKDKRHLILTLRDVGRFPAYKELYAEYTWSDGHVRSAASEQGLSDRHRTDIGGSLPTLRAPNSSDIFTRNKRPGGIPLQADIFLPTSQGHRLEGHLHGDYQEDNLDDLSDAGSNESFNLEEWAEQMKDSENVNQGYISDSELDIVVHYDGHPGYHGDKDEDHNTDREDDEFHEREGTRGEREEITFERNVKLENLPPLYPDSDSVAVDSDQNEPVEAMYARIEKNKGYSSQSRQTRNTITNTDSSDTENDSGNEGTYQLRPRKGSGASVSFLLRNQDADGVSNHPIDGENTDNNVLYLSESHQGEMKTEKGESAFLEGGLYSRVRKLSVASLSHHRPSSPSPSSSPSSSAQKSSPQFQRSRSPNDGSDQDNDDYVTPKSNSTVEVRVIGSTPVKVKRDSVDEEDAALSTHLAVHGFNGNPYDISESEGLSSSLGEEPSRMFDFDDKNDENVTVFTGDLDARISDLERRKMTIGLQELNTLSHDQHVEEREDRKKSISGESGHSVATNKSGKWKSFKKKIKGSLRLKSSSKNETLKIEDTGMLMGSVRKKRGVFERTFGGKVLHQNTVDGYSLAVVEDSARKMLAEEEFEAVMRHIKTYHDSHELERLVQVLLAILDKPEKLLLLRDVRGVIYPLDTVQFDSMVNKYEIEAYENLSMKLHLPLQHNKVRKPRRTLMTTQIANNGHFHIRSMDQYNREHMTKEAVVEVLQETAEGGKTSGLTGGFTLTHADGFPDRPGQLEEGSETLGHLGSQRSAAVMSITDQFGYLDQESSEGGPGIATLSDFHPTGKTGEKLNGAIVVHLSKNKPTLGVSVTESTDPTLHNVIKIAGLEKDSAAADDSSIEIGMVLVSVDGHSMLGCTGSEADLALSKAFEEKQHVSMKLVLLPETVDTYM